MSHAQPGRRGWTAYVEVTPATTMSDMPPQLAKSVTDFIVTLAHAAGVAIDGDRQPPGDPLDDLGIRYGVQVDREPVIFEYTVLREIREIRVPLLVWFR